MIERTNREIVKVYGREALEVYRDGALQTLGVYGRMTKSEGAILCAALLSVYAPDIQLPPGVDEAIDQKIKDKAAGNA